MMPWTTLCSQLATAYFTEENLTGLSKILGQPTGVAYHVVLNNQSFLLPPCLLLIHWLFPGNDGYVLMAQRDNNCGIATKAAYVTI